MNAHIRKLWDMLRSSYWFVPSIMMTFAAILWFVARLAEQLLIAKGALPTSWLYLDDRASVRSLLLTIAASTIGVVGVVFSIMMVPLTIAASQFGPRLLRNFLRDKGTQITLGIFTSTFLYCMLVVIQLREEASKPLPQLTVTIGLLLGVASFIMLIYFINHVAVSIQASVVVSEVSNDLHAAIDRELPEHFKKVTTSSNIDRNNVVQVDLTDAPYNVIASGSGYVQLRDDKRLMGLAKENDLVINLLSEPGDFVSEFTALALIWPKDTASGDIIRAVNDSYILGSQRTLVQDVTFGINELVELAIRALSPAINDPFTAMACLDWLGTSLCRICMRAIPAAKQYDEKGMLRLITNPITFASLTDAAFNQIRNYGRTSTMVMLRMLDTIGVITQCISKEEQRIILLHHAELVLQSAQIGLPESIDIDTVTHRFNEVSNLLEMSKHKTLD